MIKLKSLLIALPVSLLTFVLVAAPVDAHGDEDHEQTNSQTTNDDSSHEAKKKRERIRKAEEHSRKKSEQLLKEAKKEQEKRQLVKEERKKRCENRKQALLARTERIANNAQKHQKRIEGVFVKAVDYQESANVNVPDFDALVATASAAQSASQDSVQALTNLKPTIDCTGENAATAVATFKAAVEQARNDLSTYKKNIKAILTALKAAKEQ